MNGAGPDSVQVRNDWETIMGEWFEDERFWKETFSFLFPEERFHQAAEEIDRVLKLTEIHSGRVLDLCCGPGRCALALKRRGFEVTGVDRTAFLLGKARERGLAENLDIEWVQEDMRRFNRPNHYDLLINMFTSFGYFENKDEDRRVLRNMYESLKPGGVCLIDTMSKEILAKIYQPHIARELPGGSLLVERPEILEDWTRVKCRWVFVHEDRVVRLKLEHTIYSGQELKERLEAAGFSRLLLYGDLDGRAYGPDAERLVVVARK